MANRKKSHRPRSRKPRPDSSRAGETAAELSTGGQGNRDQGAGAQDIGSRGAARRSGGTGKGPKSKPRAAERSRTRPSAVTRTYGERPQAPWHPLPLSELLIVVGAVGAWIGLNRGVSHGGPPLFAGLAAVLLGTVEVTLREHRGGYRSHTMLLSLLPVVIFHTLIVLAITAFTHVPPILNLALLGVDLALFVLLFRLWRARFVDARRVRAFGGR